MALSAVTIRGATTFGTTSLTKTQSFSTTSVVVTQINRLGGGHGLGSDTILAAGQSVLLTGHDSDAGGATLPGGGAVGFSSWSNLSLTGGDASADTPTARVWRSAEDWAAAGGGTLVLRFETPGGGVLGGNSVAAGLRDLLPGAAADPHTPPEILPVKDDQRPALGSTGLSDGTQVQFGTASPPGTIEVIFGKHG